MYKVLISGYYGFNNIGDESILRAVVDNLQGRLEDIEITVLSQDPVSTAEKYGVKSVNRKSVKSIVSAVSRCDLLISGGGSLLQDVTSKKSILYYLIIMWMALLFRKKIFIYSQGIGPINSSLNRKLTSKTLSKVSGIVVRDEASKEFLAEIGVDCRKVVVTADPVLRIKRAPLIIGEEILRKEGINLNKEQLTVGFAIRERKLNSEFVDELCIAMERLVTEKNAQIVLIPFHFSEDVSVIEEIEKRLGEKVYSIKHKYLTNEMLSIIGNMDLLVGVRLHALIHSAIMNVPMIAISYDPKINSFMKSIGMKAMCSIYDFNSEDFIDEFNKTLQHKEVLKKRVQNKLIDLTKALDTNEEMIKNIMEK
ncbi:polysaccharide pyruvyl transferase CsaB [Aminipila sp.]|jgi:polysaccharide pyruvyl transferase CsaB|uniref:polysaccharide pyruvyl transferase CsaB n=1 Tax=Aminipila sp. TaxID=2060095 RepID=UPI001D5B2EBF|nr:polysaccharide pyruvyl transferase CsaB [Aminipila sp.]MBE6034223.1 polysaccharide pyruvyl transferase CsaB [Clostridiales bacterium]